MSDFRERIQQARSVFVEIEHEQSNGEGNARVIRGRSGGSQSAEEGSEQVGNLEKTSRNSKVIGEVVAKNMPIKRFSGDNEENIERRAMSLGELRSRIERSLSESKADNSTQSNSNKKNFSSNSLRITSNNKDNQRFLSPPVFPTQRPENHRLRSVSALPKVSPNNPNRTSAFPKMKNRIDSPTLFQKPKANQTAVPNQVGSTTSSRPPIPPRDVQNQTRPQVQQATTQASILDSAKSSNEKPCTLPQFRPLTPTLRSSSSSAPPSPLIPKNTNRPHPRPPLPPLPPTPPQTKRSKNLAYTNKETVNDLRSSAENVTNCQNQSVDSSRQRLSSSEGAPLSKYEHVTRELISTEESYVKDLRIIIKVFMEPLQATHAITPTEFNSIFSNIRSILSINEELFEGFLQNKISDSLLRVAELFKVYSIYCNNHENSVATIDNLRSNPAFASFLKFCLAKPECHALDLGGFLIKPVQRICKYPLLLRELIKYTDNPNEKVKLEKALESITATCSYINEKKKKIENKNRLVSLRNALVIDKYKGEPFELVEPARYIVSHGYITRVSVSLLAVEEKDSPKEKEREKESEKDTPEKIKDNEKERQEKENDKEEKEQEKEKPKKDKKDRTDNRTKTGAFYLFNDLLLFGVPTKQQDSGLSLNNFTSLISDLSNSFTNSSLGGNSLSTYAEEEQFLEIPQRFVLYNAIFLRRATVGNSEGNSFEIYYYVQQQKYRITFALPLEEKKLLLKLLKDLICKAFALNERINV